MQVNLFPLFDGTADSQSRKMPQMLSTQNFREALLMLRHGLYQLIRSPWLRQIHFKLEEVRAAGELRECEGTLKSMGCLAQYKWR